MNKIRVLFATATTKGGGAERMLFNIIRSLDQQHDKRLFITSDEKVPDIYANDVAAINAHKKHAMSSFRCMLKELHDYKPHHVFTTSSNVGYMLVLAKKLLRAKFKIYIRCAVPPSELYQHDFKTKILNQVIRMTYNSADFIIAQTEYSRIDLIKHYALNPQKVQTIRNIVDTDFVNQQSVTGSATELKPSNYNIVAAGALYSVKGFDILIDSIADCIAGTDRHLYILGEERYEAGYKQFLSDRITERGLESHIHLLGHKENPYPYLRQADLFVMSSRKEGFPNVVLEALTLGTPVIATDVVDWKGVILEGKNGFIANKNNVASLRCALKQAFVTTFDVASHRLSNFDYNDFFS